MSRKPDTEEQKAQKIADREKERAAYAQKRNRLKPETQQQTNIATMETTPAAGQQEGGDNPAPASTETPETSAFNPTGGKRFQRAYSNPPVDQRLLEVKIPEADFGNTNSGSVDDMLKERSSTSSASSNSGSATKPPQPGQQIAEQLGTENLSLGDSKQQAEELVSMGLEAYDELWQFGAGFVKVKEEKMHKKHSEGKLNMHAIAVPAEQDPRGNGITNIEFIKSINSQIEAQVRTTQTFKDQITPPLTRLAMKYKLGISDEGKVAILFGKDMFKKSVTLYQMSKLMSGVIESMEKGSEAAIEAHVSQRTEELANKSAQAMSELMDLREKEKIEYEKRLQDLEAMLTNKKETSSEKSTGTGAGIALTIAQTGKEGA